MFIEKEQKLHQSKISQELLDLMSTKSSDELISIYVWKRPIPENTINKKVLEISGLNSNIYENKDQFNSEVAAKLSQIVIDQLGTEPAHKIDRRTGLTPINARIHKEIDTYIETKRRIIRQEYLAINNAFIKTYVSSKPRKIFYCSEYTPTLALEATIDEIKEYAKLDEVMDVSLLKNEPTQPMLGWSLGQVNADGVNGSKSANFNNGQGYRGRGVKIGIIEGISRDEQNIVVGGKYKSTASQLTQLLQNGQLSYIINYRADNTAVPYVEEGYDYSAEFHQFHATKVTSIIVGTSITYNNNIYEGVAPASKVYQTTAENTIDVFTGFQALVNEGVHVINYSGGHESNLYASYDREIDLLISITRTSFVTVAGNTDSIPPNYNVTSPGKALNAITVGNAITKINPTQMATSPYNIATDSKYSVAGYLPNKPDIAAPGENIKCLIVMSYMMLFNNASGTSFSAAIVSGIIAQTMEMEVIFKVNPNLVKSYILCVCANQAAISNANNPPAGNYLNEKSGTGLIDAQNLGTTYADYTTLFNTVGTTASTPVFQLTVGQKIRAVLVFQKNNINNIDTPEGMDDIDIKLINSANSTVAFSISTRNNVEIIEYTVPNGASGQYQIRLDAFKITDEVAGVLATAVWRIY